jgi:putative ABC transport system ATP-binding protein
MFEKWNQRRRPEREPEASLARPARRGGEAYNHLQGRLAKDGTAEPIIRLSRVVKEYQTANGSFRALKSTDLDVYPGEFLSIVGKSGAGKTTLINMISGVDHLTSGEVWIDGMPVHAMDENRLALWRGRKMGIIYQSFHLMPSLSLLDNVMLPMDFCGTFAGRQSIARAMDLLRQVELENHAYKRPSAISGGQQQRVAIARALANDPPIIVADEPTGRLDSVTAELIFKIFLDLVAAGKTVIMVTHDRSLAQRTTRTLQIVDGELHAQPSTAPTARRQGTTGALVWPALDPSGD